MVEEWLKSHPKWTATKTQKINILLDYCTAFGKQNKQQQNLLMRYNIQMSLGSRSRKFISCDASDHHLHPEQLNPPALGKVNRPSILQHMLQKVLQLHSPRYGQFLRQQSNLETLLLQFLRKGTSKCLWKGRHSAF